MITAAKTNSTEAIKLLIENNYSDPNFADEDGNTALTLGILSENIKATEMLLSITTQHLDISLKALAKAKSSSFKVTQNIEDKVKKIISNDKELLWIFLERISFFGNDHWYAWFLMNFPEEMSYFGNLEEILRNIIMSDNSKACELIQTYFEKHLKNKELQKLALSRGKTEVLKALKLEKRPHSALKKFFGVKDKDLVVDDIYQRLPKFVEFPYDDNIAKVTNKLKSLRKRGRKNVWVKLKDLKEWLKAPNVHYGEKYKDGCPSNCTHMTTCLRVRQIEKLVLDAANRVAQNHPIFKGAELLVVGSMKEGTKVGAIDEADMMLIGNSRLKEYFWFDDDNQEIKATWKYNVREDEEECSDLDEFIEDGKLSITKYFNTFLEGMQKGIDSGKADLPKGLKLSNKYTPCEICRDHEDVIPQDVRCRHKPNCKDHKKKKDNPQHKESCNCRVFTSPCMSFTKIGLAMSLKFDEPDGSQFNIDVDVSPPTIPVINNDWYNGSNKKKKEWLEKHRPVNWIPEWRKSYDMTAAAEGGKRSVRLRRVNRNLVIPERV